MFFMAAEVHGHFGKTHIGNIIIELFIKDAVRSARILFNIRKDLNVWILSILSLQKVGACFESKGKYWTTMRFRTDYR